MLLELQRHQYTLDRPFSNAYSQPWLVAGATTAILPSLGAPQEDFCSRVFSNLSQATAQIILAPNLTSKPLGIVCKMDSAHIFFVGEPVFLMIYSSMKLHVNFFSSKAMN